MARRKIALTVIFFVILVLILSPWASAPGPSTPAAPEQSAAAAAKTQDPVKVEDPVTLKVAAALDEAEFAFLRKLNEENAYYYPEISVELTRVAPDVAYTSFRNASRLGEAADVMLLENEWVLPFAVSGFLMPADNAFAREALSDQFDAIISPLKWNGYVWGVPRDYDPYVLVWNLDALYTVAGPDAPLPKDITHWAEMALKSGAAGEHGIRWLAIDDSNPYAMLAWLQSVTGQRSDAIWSDGANVWNGTLRGEALQLLDRERAGLALGNGSPEVAGRVSSGAAVCAVLPYSEAKKLLESPKGGGSAGFTMDLSAWKLPHMWPRGRSFAVSSRTPYEEAARKWIAAMTDSTVQQKNWDTFGKLPVYRSLYRQPDPLSTLFPDKSSAGFPHQAPAESGPSLSVRMSRLSELWSGFASGAVGIEEWVRRWPETSADFQLDN